MHEGSASYAYGWIGSAVAKVVIDYSTTATFSAGQVLGRDTLTAV